MTTRVTQDECLIAVAEVISTRATCVRRRVGCVLADGRGRVLSTGYNGPPSGFPHCTSKNPCPGAEKPPGTGLDVCQAVHAEQNAMLQCPDADRIHTCYVTTAPCVTCVKLLLNTPCRRILFEETYPHEEASRALWTDADKFHGQSRAWVRVERMIPAWVHLGKMTPDPPPTMKVWPRTWR